MGLEILEMVFEILEIIKMARVFSKGRGRFLKFLQFLKWISFSMFYNVWAPRFLEMDGPAISIISRNSRISRISKTISIISKFSKTSCNGKGVPFQEIPEMVFEILE